MRLLRLALACSVALIAAAPGPADWEKTVAPPARGSFPNPRPLRATYQFGWNDLVAATARVTVAKVGDQLQLIGSGRTLGVARALWPFDVEHRALADAATLRPISMHEVDIRRGKIVTTDLAFNPEGVVRIRTDSKAKHPPKPKTFRFRGLCDLHSALLFIRSQPLKDGDVQKLVVYPATNAYLATATVAAHENITVGAGSYKAIRLDLKLNKIGKERELEPHKKFRSASVWLSDDNDRLLLRIEAGIFIGTVFCQLQTVEFPKP